MPQSYNSPVSGLYSHTVQQLYSLTLDLASAMSVLSSLGLGCGDKYMASMRAEMIGWLSRDEYILKRSLHIVHDGELEAMDC